MNKFVIGLIVGILLGAAGAAFFATAPQDEPPTREVVTLPELPVPYYTVLFENEAVRIVDHQLEPGGVEPEHTHAPMLAYFVEGATLMITEADGSAAEVTIPTGAFVGADNLRWWTHALENTGETRLHTILIELKHDPAGD